MNTRLQLVCAHTAPLYCLMIGTGLFIIPGWLPPPAPGLSAAAVAAWFPNNPMLHIGMLMVLAAGYLTLGLPVAMNAQLRRIEGASHVMANFQLAIAIMASCTVIIAALFWLVACFHPDLPPAIILAFNDFGWFVMVSDAVPTVLQNGAIGLCILSYPLQTVYPRWLGYWNIWLGLTTLPGLISFFLKTGPFAWNGILAFWLPVSAYFAWVILNYIWTVKAILRQRRQAQAAPASVYLPPGQIA